MAYLSNKNKPNISTNKNNRNNMPKNNALQNNKNKLELVRRKNNLNNKKENNKNNYGNVNANNNENVAQNLEEKLKSIKEKQKKESARKAIVTGLKAYNPAIGEAADKVLKTEKGEKLLDAYAKGDTPTEGINNVKKELKNETRKQTLIITFASLIIPLLFLLIIVALISTSVDTQIFSNENGGTVESDDYQYDDPNINVFANYPGLYEKVVSVTDKVSDEYQIEVDKYLILATLISPIDNELVTPIDDGSCGEDKCYYFKGESKTWSEFIDSLADQTELLAKMQIMTYTNNGPCNGDQTLEQYAQNDLETNTFPWYGWLNPANWFKGFRDAANAELNAKCTNVDVPEVKILSINEGNYYLTNNASKEYNYVKESNSGGVYFWNIVNENGFIHQYLKDYLSDEFSDNPDKNYEINKNKIVETTNDIYAYYETIRKDCDGYKVIEGKIDKINTTNGTVDFEDQYIGGVLLAEHNGASLEAMKAYAIIARTKAVSAVGIDGTGVMDSSIQNYDSSYNPDSYPIIKEAVESTRGMVLTNYKEADVLPLGTGNVSSETDNEETTAVDSTGESNNSINFESLETAGYNKDAMIKTIYDGTSIRILSNSIPSGKCTNAEIYKGEKKSTTSNNYSSSDESSGSNYGYVTGGTALTKPLTEALSENGYTIDDLNKCIGDRVTAAGMGTREGVVEAGMSLLECTMKMTGGYTYPYDHRGGYVGGNYNSDIKGKLGVNSKWGEIEEYATGCSSGENCRLGLNCANYVRWAMCNGGMDLCDKGSTFATGMAGVNSNENYFPGAIRVQITPTLKVLNDGSLDKTKQEVIEMIKPGDVLYSDNNGTANHVMLVVATDSNSITVAENGRKTRKIAKSEFESNTMTYVVLLLDNYYSNSSNKNSLTW